MDIDTPLSEDNTVEVAELLTPAKSYSFVLGLKLNLPLSEVETTHQDYSSQDDRFIRIIIKFLQKAQPAATWRVIIDALRSPLVGLNGLARRVEDRARMPLVQQYPHRRGRRPRPPQSNLLSRDIHEMVINMERKFDSLKHNIRHHLERERVPVLRVADALTSLSADHEDHHRLFLESHVSVLFRAVSNFELFGTMNFHWNYLDPSLLDHLVIKFDLNAVKDEMKTYKSDLEQFRKGTPLTLFCQSQKRRRIQLSPDFQEVIAEFDWTNDVTLDTVEQFRQEYASHYKLYNFAMRIGQIISGSFIVTFLIPESVVEKLKEKVPRDILQRYFVTNLKIAGACIYCIRKPQEVVAVDVTPSSGSVPAAFIWPPVESEEYPLIEQPPDDFFCPVTLDLLLLPHLTSCFGKHVSHGVAMNRQGEGKACPICGTQGWSTVLNRHFQRQVRSLRVFCRHEARGCEWKGELRDLDSHPCAIKETKNEQQQNQVTTQGETEKVELAKASDGQASDGQASDGQEPEKEELTKLKEASEELSQTEDGLIDAHRKFFKAERKLIQKKNELEHFKSGITRKPHRVVGNLDSPYGIAFNNSGQMIVSEWGISRVSVLDENGTKLHSFRSEGMIGPSGVAVDDDDNIYVTSNHKLQKFTSRGVFIKYISNEDRSGDLESPRGLIVHDGRLYVADRSRRYIQVYDLNLEYVTSIGRGEGEFSSPFDVKFDDAGNMYVAEFDKKRVQVLDTNGQCIREIGQVAGGLPTGLHVHSGKVYVSDFANDHIVEYTTSGQHVKEIAYRGHEVGDVRSPYCITSHGEKLYVCDCGNNRVCIFDIV